MDAASLDPQLAWAQSGAMALSGRADRAPRLAPGPLARFARTELAALCEASASDGLRGIDAAELLGERAAVAGLGRRGRRSPGGSCGLLAANDGWLALNLARPVDIDLLPAWLESPIQCLGRPPWEEVENLCSLRAVDELVERARLLGLPVAPAAPAPASAPEARAPARAPAPHRITARGPQRAPGPMLRVLDLASLWAGPLCAHLLESTGADVVKVESRYRPDGARLGPRGFFDRINAGKRSAALDLRTQSDRRALRRLIARADIVVESSRPRALRQLDIHAEELLASTPGLVWVSITGYGRACDGVAFGDDAACAAGLAAATGTPDAPLFCGDAIADPLAGIHAAHAAWEARTRGGGVLLDIALRDVAAHAADGDPGPARVRRRGDDWLVECAAGCSRVADPIARPLTRAARPLGADTRSVLC